MTSSPPLPHPAPAAPHPAPFLSACIMCKDEGRFLERTLTSLKGVVDEVILIDTGSTDDSVAIAARHGAKISHIPWADDFSATRNATIDAASGRWVLIIDGDEHLEGALTAPGALKKTIQDFEERTVVDHWPGVFVRLSLVDKMADETAAFASAKQLRIFPKHPLIRYESPIHNRLTLAPELHERGAAELDLDSADLTIVHRGYDPAIARDKRKSERAMRILTKAIADRPDALNYFYLGREHAHAEHWSEAVSTLTTARDLIDASPSQLDKHHLQAVYFYLVTSMHKAGSPLEAIRFELLTALARFPTSPDLWHEAGVIFLAHGELEGARGAFRQAVQHLPQAAEAEMSFLMFRPWLAHLNLAQVEAALGDDAAGRVQLAQAIAVGLPDADAAHDALAARPVDGIVVAGVATMPARTRHLQLMLSSMLPQVDEIWVYLNNFEDHEVPAFLEHPKIHVHRSQRFASDGRIHGDLRDTGKFWMSHDRNADYFFAVDDDIVYPANYVCTLVDKLNFYGRAVVGVHGAQLRQPLNSYIQDRDVLHCLAELNEDTPVDVLGTGTMAFKPRDFDIWIEDFEVHGMADIWASLAAKRQGLPLIAVTRRAGWITVLEVTTGTLYEEAAGNDHVQTRVAQQLLPALAPGG